MAMLPAACSDEADSEAVESTTTVDDESSGSSSELDPRSPEELAADEAAAAEVVLTLDDFEPGWTATPAEEPDADDEELEAELGECVGADEELWNADFPSATSPDFSSEDDSEVSAEVGYAPSVEVAEAVMETWQDPDLPGCFAEALRDTMTEAILNPEEGSEPPPEGVEFGDPTFEPMSFAGLGDDTMAYRVTVPFSASGLDFELYQDFVFVRVGRVGVTGTFQSVLSPFPSDEAEALMAVMVDRVPAAA